MPAVESENGGYGGITLVVTEHDENVTLLKAYGDADTRSSLSDFGITPDQILNRTPILFVNNTTYSCNYSTIEGTWDGWENPVMIQMLPVVTIGARSAVQSAIIGYAMALILVNIIVYVISVQHHVRDNVITEAQSARYTPKKLRVRMNYAAVISVIAIFVVTTVVQGVGQLYTELRYGQDTLRVLSKQMERTDYRQNKRLQRIQEDWYVFYGKTMAALLAEYPGLATSGTLQTWCDILNVDFIMLFDNQGKETLCSQDYVGFTLDRGLGQNSSEFRRLLYGMSSIVHEPSTDSITGMERQMIGVKLPTSGFEDQHGALIMALLPEQTKQAVDLYHVDDRLALLQTNATLCFNANATTGVIQHAGDTSMIGQTVEECGLPEKSLRDGYMDFGVVNGTRRFIVTSKQGNYIFYYALELGAMFNSILVYAGIVTALFALALVFVLWDLFRGYNDGIFAKWAVICMPGEDPEALRAVREKMFPEPEAQTDAEEGKKPGPVRRLVKKLSEAIHWKERTPEDKTNLMFKASLMVLLISWASLLLSRNMVYSKYDSLAGFLLQGDWMRGANPFAFCSILLVTVYAYLINLFSQSVLLMISGFMLGKGPDLLQAAAQLHQVFFAVCRAVSDPPLPGLPHRHGGGLAEHRIAGAFPGREGSGGGYSGGAFHRVRAHLPGGRYRRNQRKTRHRAGNRRAVDETNSTG